MGHAAQILVEDLHPLLSRQVTFSALDERLLSRLLEEAEVVTLAPNDVFKDKKGSAVACDRLYFVVQGQIGVVKEQALGIEGKTPKSHLPNPGREYVLYLWAGDFFSGEFLGTVSSSPDRSIKCVAIMHTTLMSVPAKTVHQIMAVAPRWANALRDRSGDLRKHYDKHRSGDLRVVQNFFLQHNFSYATTLKVIDLDRCIGCDGCERACADRHGVARLQRKGPVLGRLSFAVACRTCVDHRCFDACGFDAISLLENDEVKIDQQKCVGCAACYTACPNDVITMLEKPYSGEDFKEKLPSTDLVGQTNIPGLYLAGENTGTALIKLAINSGRAAVEHLVKELGGAVGKGGEVFDVIIAGAGPAGLSAGLTAKELGLHFKLFDKGHFAETIQMYPRHKIVMAEPMHIPLYGNLWLKDTTKEELIEQWRVIIDKTGLQIESNQPITGVVCGADGNFEVTTSKGKYRAKKVVLAIGSRGAPRKLGCEGEAAPRVRYALTDTDEFRGKRCLVVGGGDSAVEAAMSLADVPGTTVTLSYRKDSFGRIKPRNKTRLDEYEKSKRVTVILESEVKALRSSSVIIKTKTGEIEVANDNVFAMLGAEPPTKLFEKIGIKILEPGTPDMEAFAKSRGNRRYASKCDHCTGHSDQACISACPTNAILEIKPDEVFAPKATDDGRRRPFRVEPFENGIPPSDRMRRAANFGLSFALIASLLVGLECFLRRAVPEWCLLYHWQKLLGQNIDVTFSSGAGLGYALGIAGMSLMAVTSLYPLHSRLGLFRSIAKTRFWLAAHILAGILGPVLVTYHTAMKLDRWPSIAFWLVWAVVVTGAIGRHVVTYVRRAHGLADIKSVVADQARQSLVDELSSRQGHTMVLDLLDLVPVQATASQSSATSALGASFSLMAGEAITAVEHMWMKHVKLRSVADPYVRDRALEVLAERKKQEQKRAVLSRIERSASLWRWAHLLSTVVMFAVAIAHVVAAMLFKVG